MTEQHPEPTDGVPGSDSGDLGDSGDSIFRQAALSHYLQGTETSAAAPITRPPWLRSLWLALFAAMLVVVWVGGRPVPSFERVQMLLPVHECHDEVGSVLMVLEGSAQPSLAEGRTVVVEHLELGQREVVLSHVEPETLLTEDIAERLGCPVELDGLASWHFAVAAGELSEGSIDESEVLGGAVGRIEIGTRRLVSLLPIWPGSVDTDGAPEATAGEDGS